MPGQGTRVAPLFMMGGGAILIWSGVTNRSLSTVLKALIQGKQPPASGSGPNVIGPTTSTTTSTVPQVGTGAGIPGLTSGPLPGAKAPSGAVLTPGQISSLWIMAGGSPFKASVATCIAMHESGGRVAVTSSNPDGGTNVGLWQLDTPGGKGAGHTVAQLQNALTNAIVAVRGSNNGTDWSAWATAGACGV